MPINNTIFRDLIRITETQRAERNTQSPTAAITPRSRPLPGTFDGPSDPRTRPRHHFRRGAVSEASGRPYIPIIIPAVDGPRGRGSQELRIRSSITNQLELELVQSTRRQHPVNHPQNRPDLAPWIALADQISRGLVNLNAPGLRAGLNAAAATLENHRNRASNHPAMESNDFQFHHRDTYRFGREGWWTVEESLARSPHHSATTTRGSSSPIPHSTLNLFQSIDLFASPPPNTPPTVSNCAIMVYLTIQRHCQRLEHAFHRAVTARRQGQPPQPGKLFLYSMELSRARQLESILAQEFEDMGLLDDDNAASASTSSRRRRRASSHAASADSDDADSVAPYPVPEADRAGSEVPDGWRDLDFVFDGEFPREICFHLGAHEVTVSVEEVESWIMDERPRGRRTRVRREDWLGRERQMQRDMRDVQEIWHSFAVPDPVVSRAWSVGMRAFDLHADAEEDDGDAEHDPNSYGGGEEGWRGGFRNNYDLRRDPGSDMPDTEYEVGDDSDGTVEDLDHEGWGGPTSEGGSQDAEQSQASGGSDGQSSDADADADANAPVADPPNHPFPPDSNPPAHPASDLHSSTRPPSELPTQPRSQNTSDESTPNSSSATSSLEPPAPHPITDWTNHHHLFLFSCRGTIFSISAQVQHAFAFSPPLTPAMVGARLNGIWAGRHRHFISSFLPGETGIDTRAERRDAIFQRRGANEDVYHGTQDIEEADEWGDGYQRPPMPGARAPRGWDRGMDVSLLRELQVGRVDLEGFWRHQRERVGDGGAPLMEHMNAFLGVRLAQVRYLGITEEEVQAHWRERMGRRG